MASLDKHYKNKAECDPILFFPWPHGPLYLKTSYGTGDSINKTKETLVPSASENFRNNTIIQPTNYSTKDTLWLFVYDYVYYYDYDYVYVYDY